MRILITGATGNVGLAVIQALARNRRQVAISAAVRNHRDEGNVLKGYNISPVTFDFEKEDSFSNAFTDIDILFLLRPPQLSNVRRVFVPLIREAARAGIKHIVFLSVQGVEKNVFIPHHKIEAAIVESGIPYTFLRPILCRTSRLL